MTPLAHRWRAREALRVGIVVHSFPALSQTFVIDQAAALRAAGVDVRIFARHFEQGGLRHARGRELLGFSSFLERTALERLSHSSHLPGSVRQRFGDLASRRFYGGAARHCDLLLCHFGPVGLETAQRVRGIRGAAPLWTIFHGYDLSVELRRRGADVYAPLFGTGDRFLPISRFWANRLVELGCPADRIHVLHMGVDCRDIAFAPAAIPAGEPVRILSVGRLVEKKGTEFALRALGELKAQDWRFDVVGEGPRDERLQSIAEDLGIRDRVNFLGGRSAEEVRSLLSRSHIFLLPSVIAKDGDMEGIPVALMEAMAAGVAVMSTYHSGIPELVENGVTGLLAPEGDVAQLASKLHELISDPNLRSCFTHAARAKVETDFNQARIARDLIKTINDAVVGIE